MVVILLKSFAALFSALPLGAALCVGRALGRFFALIAPRHRRRALENLAACFPEKSEAELRGICHRMFVNQGMNMVEMFRWMGGRDAELRARIDASELREDLVRDARRGLVALVAHVGNFDLMGLWAASIVPLTIISKEIKNAGLNQFWMEKRASAGLNIVPAHNSYRACLNVIKKGGVLGFILDQNMTRKEGVFVDFFGRPACTTAGLAMLAWHSQAPVLPFFMVRKPDGSHHLLVKELIPPPASRDERSLTEATQRYTKVIEDVIRAYPDQWIWMHRRWRTQPLADAENKKD